MTEQLNKAINDLLQFLLIHKSGHNINYFITTLQEMSSILKNSHMSEETVGELKLLYKSMFFPREGLSDFYILNQDKILMNKYNNQYASLLRAIDELLN